MNKSVSSIIRLAAVILLVVLSLSTVVSCDKLDEIIGSLTGGNNDTPGENENPGEDTPGENEKPDDVPGNDECKHENVSDSKCDSCGEIFLSTVAELLAEGYTPDGMVYIKVSVDSVNDSTKGGMTVSDATGSIDISALYSNSGAAYSKMENKPDEEDELLLLCNLNTSGDTVSVKLAFVVEHKAVGGTADIDPSQPITIAQAIELAKANPEGTADRYYIRATVKTISNPSFGEMTIIDETGELYVYGTYSSDGELKFPEISDKPVKGDEVLLHCILSVFDDEPQVKNARLIEVKHDDTPFDETNYTAMSIADARAAEAGAKVIVSGVVARITYANGKIPSGVILVDGTSSIYVYDGDIAGQVAIGNTIKVAGDKTYWVLGSEADNANKFGYKGANQLDSATLISNDNGNTAYDKSWITETTVKAIMDTPVSEDITSKIFKVTALVKKVPGSGFVNYYIDDLDGATGSYVYTQCNGSDFAWIDEFDGKICTVYIVAINAKSSTSGCVWRFLPIEIIDESFSFDLNDTPKFAVDYHGLVQFLGSYTGDPAKELVTSVSSELLGFEGATLSYASSNESVVYFTTADGKTVFHCGEAGTATVTVTGTYGEKTYSATVDITVSENLEIDYITVAEAIATDKDTDVTVKGIVGPSLVNQQGFYLFGEDGSMIAVKVNSTDVFDTIAIGNEIVITGMRERYIEDDTFTTYGQDAIVNAEVVANYYGNHAYSTEKFITDKTLADIYALDATKSHSTEVYVVKATVEVVETAYYTNINIVSGSTKLGLYCSSANQYNWLKAYTGQEVTLEIAPCNWNDKTYYRGCVLAVVNEDGTKVLNTFNFQ